MAVNKAVLRALEALQARAQEDAEDRLILDHIAHQEKMINEQEDVIRKQQARIKFLEATDALR